MTNRHALEIEKVEAQRAKARQTANLKRGNKKPVTEQMPEREKGEARDKAGGAVGVSA
jgi:hypothetical protein